MNWPYTLLPTPYDAVELAVENNNIRTEMESGRVRQRQRFSASTRKFSAKWNFTETQFALFQSFVKYKLSGGSLAFNMDFAQGDGGLTVSGEMRIVSGNYSASRGRGLWSVSAVLEVFDAQPSSESIFDDITLLVSEGFAIEEVLAWPNPLHELVHTDMPELAPAP